MLETSLSLEFFEFGFLCLFSFRGVVVVFGFLFFKLPFVYMFNFCFFFQIVCSLLTLIVC